MYLAYCVDSIVSIFGFFNEAENKSFVLITSKLIFDIRSNVQNQFQVKSILKL